MKLTAIQTAPIRPRQLRLAELVDRYVERLPPRSVLAVSAKVVALCEGRVVKIGDESKDALVRREADYFLPAERNAAGIMVTIKRDTLIAFAGVDESNGDGYYVLWPEDPQASANHLREHLRQRLGYAVGVLITDSRVTPMRRGTVGLGLAHSGFAALINYVGTADIFGQPLKHTYGSVIDGLAAAAVVVMGEGAQTTPLVVVEEVGFITFQDRNPTPAELTELRIPLEEDVYAEMLKAAPWDKRPEES